MESGRLKLSLFDTKDKTKPVEVDKFTLNDYGSETLYNHHAFLHDKERELFFIPSYSGGYLFSYKNNKIDLMKAVSGYDIKRALYVNDYIYIVSESKIVIFDKEFNKINEISF
jgi:inhibitor of cysteine peptidase